MFCAVRNVTGKTATETCSQNDEDTGEMSNLKEMHAAIQKPLDTLC